MKDELAPRCTPDKDSGDNDDDDGEFAIPDDGMAVTL